MINAVLSWRYELPHLMMKGYATWESLFGDGDRAILNEYH